MARFLILDVGAGTLDLLWFDDASGLHFKTVCRSPVLLAAERVMGLEGDILVTGGEMGGGAVSRILTERAGRVRVIMSESSAATIHHDPDRVRSFGIQLVPDEEAEALRRSGRYAHFTAEDLEAERILGLVRGLGVPDAFDVVGVCAQDHGRPPRGTSHLDFRHNGFRAALARDPFPESLLYRFDQIPSRFNRLRSIAASARALPCEEVYVMDSGMAAVLGASLDPEARGCRRLLVLDVATSHTVGAALEAGEVNGFFEYHTSDVTRERIEALLRDLADGRLSHADILGEGGHGAYIRRAFGFEAVERIVATGPKRALLEGAGMGLRWGAPWGDNMMTGTVGVLEAIRRREG